MKKIYLLILQTPQPLLASAAFYTFDAKIDGIYYYLDSNRKKCNGDLFF